MAESKTKSLKQNKKAIFNRLIVITGLFFFSTSILAQVNIYGDWRINKILGIQDAKEYSMVRQEMNNRWGYLLTLNLDGTFLSRNLPSCGNDIYRNAIGSFMLIDDTHIRFLLKKTSSNSFNDEDGSELELTKDLGIFYIYKDSKSIRLIESNGILEDDKAKMLYTEMAKTFDENWKSYDYSWGNTNSNSKEEIVKDCIDKRKLVNLSNCKILFSKKEDYGQLFLVREKDDLHYILYDDINKKVSLAYPR